MTKIYPKDIAEAIYSVTEGKTENTEVLLKRAVQILAKKHMLHKSEEILLALQNLIDKRSGVIRAKVITAKEIGHSNRIKIEEDIKKRYNAQKVNSEFFVREELLGGMRVEAGNEVLDNTYRNKLNKLEKFLIQG